MSHTDEMLLHVSYALLQYTVILISPLRPPHVPAPKEEEEEKLHEGKNLSLIFVLSLLFVLPFFF